MKLITTLFVFILSVHCDGQELIKPETSKPFDFSIGLSANSIFNTLKYHHFYTINDNPVVSTNQTFKILEQKSNNNALFCQMNGNYQSKTVYFDAAIGFGIDRTNVNLVTRSSSSYSNGQNTGSSVYNSDLRIKETYLSIIGSLEVGYNLTASQKRFQFGVSAGFDITGYFSPILNENTLTRSYTVEGYDTIFGYYLDSNTDDFEEGSFQWNKLVEKDHSFLLSPKLSFNATYRIMERLSLFAKAQVRYSIVLNKEVPTRHFGQFPIGIGIRYHFKPKN